MTQAFSPERWAFDITLLLNAVLKTDRFPIDIPAVAREFTAQRFPNDPIISVQGDDLPGFDGGLFRAPAGRKGWGIIYNNRIRSKGRVNFTLAHEFGHFLLHRIDHPKGFRCGEQDVVRWDSTYGQLEHQANVFAANLLMPLDDFRRQVPATSKVDLEVVSHCAERYGVSLIAAVLRWLGYTSKRAILVVSRDGFILWARSSEPALKSGAYFRTSTGPVEIPASSPVLKRDLTEESSIIDHGGGIWLKEPLREMALFSEQYDFGISLLLLEDIAPVEFADSEPEIDTYDKFQPTQPRREW